MWRALLNLNQPVVSVTVCNYVSLRVILQQREVQNVIKHGAKSKFRRRNCERADNKRLISHTWLL